MDAKAVVELFAAPFGLGAGAVFAVLAAQWVLKRLAAGGDAYASRKGENVATKEDFEQLLTQLKKNTVATEEIRASIGHKDWTLREWRGIRIRNLEPFVNAVLDAMTGHYAGIMALRNGEAAQIDPAATSKVRTLQILYYPELRQTVDDYVGACIDGGDQARAFYAKHQNSGLLERQKALDESMPRLTSDLDQIKQSALRLLLAVQVMTSEIFDHQPARGP